jgi:hypothetical protein
MRNAIGKNLLALIAAASLTGCSSTDVRNTTPPPYFSTCRDLLALDAPSVPDALIDDKVETTAVMLKLRDRQPVDERARLVDCRTIK